MTNAHMAYSEENLRPQETVLANPFPNKYHFDEFAGFEGERRLKAILRKILPLSLHRTWEVFEMAQAQGNDCYLGLVKASDDAERAQKTIRQDILEFQARKLLVLRHEVKVLRQSDGTYRRKHVLVKDFMGLYRLAHEYYNWTRSDDYIAADRDFADLILADENLIKKLRRFNNYRRILMTQTPGPKPVEREKHRWYTEFEEDQATTQFDAEDAEGDMTDQIRPKYLPEQFPKQFPEHSTDRIESNDHIESTNGDSNSTGSAETEKGSVLPVSSPTCSHIERGAIGTTREDTECINSTKDVESNRTSNSVLFREIGAEMEDAKAVKGRIVVQKGGEDEAIEVSSAPPGRPTVDQAELRPLPVYLEATHLAPLSKEWRDKAPRSSATRLAKLYWRMNQYGMDEYAFAQLLERPATKTRQKMSYDNVPNPIGYFFTVLENDINAICKAWDEELHRQALDDVQASSLEQNLFELPPPVQGMEHQEEAEALIDHIQQEMSTLTSLRLWDAAVRISQGRYHIDLDLEYTTEFNVVHRWTQTFVSPQEWEAYYAEQMCGRVQS